MFDFNKPKIEITEISDDKKYGRFVVEPLERGYGITLGNSLRRIMLSSLPGAAVSQVKIEGVLHEFSSIPGVKEDVTEIIMNLKSLAIRNNSETNEAKVAYIEFEGEGVVRASDIQVDQDIEIMNPDAEITDVNTMNYQMTANDEYNDDDELIGKQCSDGFSIQKDINGYEWDETVTYKG